MVMSCALPVPVDFEADRASAHRDLEEHGYCLIADALFQGEVDELRSRVIAIAAREEDYGSANGGAQRVWTLLNKGGCFVRISENPIAIEFGAHVLGPVTDRQKLYERCAPGPHLLLSNAVATITRPGDRVEGLNTDQSVFGLPVWDQPLVVNVAWLLDDLTESDAAVRVVPGSHRRKDTPGEEEARPVVAPAGTAVVWDGRLWHGTGAIAAGSERQHVVHTSYCRPSLRPQESFFASTDPVVVATASPTLRRLLGFEPYLTLGSVGGFDVDAVAG